MASSQVEFASSSPLDCVLRDHNSRGDRCRESNVGADVFKKNIKELVRDHFQNCISVSADENSQNPVRIIDSCGANEQYHHRNLRFPSSNNSRSNKHKRSSDDSNISYSSKQWRIHDQWATKQARDMVSNIEKQSQVAELLGSSSGTPSTFSGESSEKSPNIGNPGDRSPVQKSSSIGKPGASSLVQMWEARLNRSKSMKMYQCTESNPCRTSSGLCNSENGENPENVENNVESNVENASSGVDEPKQESETGDSSTDWEQQSDRTAVSEPPAETASDVGERERLRVADIIKKLTSGADENDVEMVVNASESPSKERRNIPMPDQAEKAEKREKRGLSMAVNSPKIRGRQAFNDLLMQIERDRLRELESLVERYAVSKFTHRGRIQSMLRIRFLQRGLAIQDQQRPKSAEPTVNRLSQGSSIMHLREKFNSGIENRVTAQSDASNSKSSQSEIAGNMEHTNNSPLANRLGDNSQNREAVTIGKQSAANTQHSEPQTSHKDQHKESSPRKKLETAELTKALNGQNRSEIAEDQEATMRQPIHLNSLNGQNRSEIADNQEATCRQDVHLKTQENSERITSLNVRNENGNEITDHLNSLNDQNRSEIADNQEATCRQNVHLNSQENSERIASLNVRNEITDHHEVDVRCFDSQGTAERAESITGHQEIDDKCLDSQEPAERAESSNRWDENELVEEEEIYEEEGNFVDTNSDWISAISRPRSYWEDRRKEWYQEMLSSSSENNEIRQLLERRRVSSYLSSDFREAMDQLMTTRVKRQIELEAYEEEEQEELSRERISELLLDHLQRNMHSAVSEEEVEEGNQVEQVDEEEQEEEEEEQSPVSHEEHETSDYFDQSSETMPVTSPSATPSWSYQGQEVGDDSDQTESESTPQPLPSQAYYLDSQLSSSSTNHLSLEMDLIYDLRGQIEQLHREMRELRKSINSCMDMQVKLQHSNPQEVHSGELGDFQYIRGMGKNPPPDGLPKKRSCCICYEMQVDSLLYRCGHMCTCLKCAHELQWSSGKCPICRAPIEDVVRAYMDS